MISFLKNRLLQASTWSGIAAGFASASTIVPSSWRPALSIAAACAGCVGLILREGWQVELASGEAIKALAARIYDVEQEIMLKKQA